MRRFSARSVVGDAVEAADWEFLSTWVLAEFGVVASARVVGGWFARQFSSNVRGWSDASWRAFVKRRVEDARLLRFGGAGTLPDYFAAELHVGFVGIEESAEHVRNLCRPDPTDIPKGPASPGISRTPEKPKPIDRVAIRVTGFRYDAGESST